MSNPVSPPNLSRLVLIVEDNAQIRNVIAQSLILEGYDIEQAMDGLDGLEKMKKRVPDLVLSDINMPRMDGLQFYRAVRENPQWTTIPFVFLTSHSAPTDIQRGKELGVEDYLTKPIQPEDLVKIINARLFRSASVEVAQVGNAYLETVKVLANAIEGRDHYTRGHVERVTTYALCIAKALGWPKQHLRMLEFGARLHDIGKIVIPGHVLNKPGRLTDKEWELMKRHTVEGARILQGIQHLRPTLPYVLYHHERWDGSGYPKGLAEKQIPIQGRILALADVYDALTTSRPYHDPRSHDDVIEIFKSESGTHFDPKLTPVFINILSRLKDRTSQMTK